MGEWPDRYELPVVVQDCAPYWLAALDRALCDRDYPAAARADSELRRLGWHVSARPPSDPRQAREEKTDA